MTQKEFGLIEIFKSLGISCLIYRKKTITDYRTEIYFGMIKIKAAPVKL